MFSRFAGDLENYALLRLTQISNAHYTRYRLTVLAYSARFMNVLEIRCLDLAFADYLPLRSVTIKINVLPNMKILLNFYQNCGPEEDQDLCVHDVSA